MKKILILFLAMVLYSTGAFAYILTGNDLNESCRSRDGVIVQVCDVFMNGYIAGLGAGYIVNVLGDFNMTSITLRNLFIHEMQENPIYGDYPAQLVILKSLIINQKVSIKKKHL